VKKSVREPQAVGISPEGSRMLELTEKEKLLKIIDL